MLLGSTIGRCGPGLYIFTCIVCCAALLVELQVLKQFLRCLDLRY